MTECRAAMAYKVNLRCEIAWEHSLNSESESKVFLHSCMLLQQNFCPSHRNYYADKCKHHMQLIINSTNQVQS